MNIKAILLSAFAIVYSFNGTFAQVVGGKNSMPFLAMSQSPYISSIGALAPASYTRNVSLFLQNPALLTPYNHNQLALSFNKYHAGIGIFNLAHAWHTPNTQTDFGFGISYLNYGTFDNTDIYGNRLGKITASDLAISLAASRPYKKHWRYGATMKVAFSQIGGSNALALLSDVGVTYSNPKSLLQIGIVAKNMGFYAKKYTTANSAEPLPFDLQIGIMKGLKNIPLKVFAVAHHLNQWDIRYSDPANIKYDLAGNPQVDPKKRHTVDKIFRHLNFGAELTLARKVKLSMAYSHLRRSENGYDRVKGLAGFSGGIGVDLKKIQIQYARSYTASANAFNEIGIVIPLNKNFKTKGKLAKWGWNQVFD